MVERYVGLPKFCPKNFLFTKIKAPNKFGPKSLIKIGSITAGTFPIGTNDVRTNVGWTNVIVTVEIYSRCSQDHSFKVSSRSVAAETSSARSATLGDTSWARLTTKVIRCLIIRWRGDTAHFNLGNLVRCSNLGGDTAQISKMFEKQGGGHRTSYLRVSG